MAGIKKGCGCFLLCAALCAGFTITFVLAGVWFARNTLANLDREPKPLPVPEISEQTELGIKVIEDSLHTMIDKGSEGSVTVSSDIINGWLRTTQETHLRFIGEHAWLTLSGERLSADVSIPLDPLGVPDRFFNGTVRVSGGLENGRVRLLIHGVTIDGASSQNLSWATKILEGRDIAGRIGLPELISPDLLKRCSILIKTSTVKIDCKAR